MNEDFPLQNIKRVVYKEVSTTDFHMLEHYPNEREWKLEIFLTVEQDEF